MDKIDNDLPLYELKIDPKKGFEVDTISIVTDPAVESSFLAFNNDDNNPKQIFQTETDDYMELLGVAMMADKKIIRINEKTKEKYNVWFSKKTIREISQQFFYKGYQHSVNLQHSDTFVDAVVFQSYIVDFDKGVYAPKGIPNVSDGSWIVGMKLSQSPSSNRLWQAIKEKIFQGFSIEGYFLDLLTKNFSLENFSHECELTKILMEMDRELNEFIKASSSDN
ncbi:XkdF-like putative serine protease domain-containing protein [Sphingobacterium sp.]|uniref:XkdF-like putative serine protease domain-containing protein n=1 Tax=Sphingobacterium sp. TaxID=341027 RepID=UPI0028AA4FC7|nr:XkdF-like putative serine protease domain-containing protein [Sphingobacterium sp.]